MKLFISKKEIEPLKIALKFTIEENDSDDIGLVCIRLLNRVELCEALQDNVRRSEK